MFNGSILSIFKTFFKYSKLKLNTVHAFYYQKNAAETSFISFYMYIFF